MTKLFLYSIFHANLKFSSIPEDHFSAVIDNCYWPILDLVNDFKVKIGVEFPTSTLRDINSIDPTLIEEIKKLAGRGQVEVLASGAVQCLFPLIPREVNEMNLRGGLDDYHSMLGVTPSSGYLNEQAYSNGLPSIYTKYGLKNLVTMWEWLAKFSKASLDDYSPQIIVGSDGAKINAIMNSYIAFQKFQRYVAGEYEIGTYMDYILKNLKENSKSCFPFYGSDWEIFGYKNTILGNDQTGKEVERFRTFLEAAEKCSEISFITPSQTVELFPPRKKIVVDSPEAAIYSKKQEKFIVTRWAVCGRDNSFSNTLCYDLYKKLSRLRSLDSMFQLKLDLDAMADSLIDCWASDYRTHTTETKFAKFRLSLGRLSDRLEAATRKAEEKILRSFSSKVVIANIWKSDWDEIPVQFKAHFAPGRFSISLDILVDGKRVKHQLEDTEFYRDGSLRSATVVITPFIKKESVAALEFSCSKRPDIRDREVGKSSIDSSVQCTSTSSTDISFLRNRGGSIEKLVFKDISKDPLVGWLEHGFYNDTQLSADFYTGHTISFDRDGVKTTDLVKVAKMFSLSQEYPIRIPVYAAINLPIGSLNKTYYVYRDQPRVDLACDFNFREYRPSSFRFGIITLNPDAFDRSGLEFSTTNGGEVEKFSVGGSPIAYDESVDPRVTSHGCLGATEEWIDIGDSARGITLFSDKSKCYSVPLLNYRETKDSFFYRIYNSIAELDDTTMTWWKGQKKAQFSIMGRKGSTARNIEMCRQMGAGLLVLSGDPSIGIEDVS